MHLSSSHEDLSPGLMAVLWPWELPVLELHKINRRKRMHAHKVWCCLSMSQYWLPVDQKMLRRCSKFCKTYLLAEKLYLSKEARKTCSSSWNKRHWNTKKKKKIKAIFQNVFAYHCLYSNSLKKRAINFIKTYFSRREYRLGWACWQIKLWKCARRYFIAWKMLWLFSPIYLVPKLEKGVTGKGWLLWMHQGGLSLKVFAISSCVCGKGGYFTAAVCWR